jgi:hypothetical protein
VLSDVRRESESLTKRLHFGDRTVHGVLLASADGYRSAFGQQPFRDGAPDSSCSAGDDGDFA